MEDLIVAGAKYCCKCFSTSLPDFLPIVVAGDTHGLSMVGGFGSISLGAAA
jgi:hypothetical protein